MNLLEFFFQYDPKGDGNQNLYYHFLDKHKPDKLIAKIQTEEADELSFQISNDHRYLILFDSQAVYAANVESLTEGIQFLVIFKLTGNISYVSVMIVALIISMILSINKLKNSVLKYNFQPLFFSSFKLGVRWK